MQRDPSPPAIEIDEDVAERIALEAAVAEARASGPGVPHELVREGMLREALALRSAIAESVRQSR